MHSGIADSVLLVAVLLGAASVVGIALRRLNFPFTVALVLVGLAGSQLSQAHGFGVIAQFELSPDLVFFVLLPALLFESAFKMEVRRLWHDLAPIAALAVVGLLICVAAVAVALWWGAGVALTLALLCGALISATDPVAVLAMFNELGAPKRLNVLVEGESLFNDGTALVVFGLILEVALGGAFGLREATHGVVHFVFVCVGGIAVGLISGGLYAKLISWVEEQPAIEVTFTVLCAFTTFLVADDYLEVSGVIATVVAGLVMGSYGRSKISPDTSRFLSEFWEYVAFVANALIFLLVGLSIKPAGLHDNLTAIIWGAAGALAARALAAYGLIPLLNRRPRSPDIDRRYQTVIFWGDLRGALALAMALTIPESYEPRQFILDFALGLVLFTLLAKGLTLGTVIRMLKLDRLTLGEAFEKEEALLLALGSAEQRISELIARGGVSPATAGQLRQAYREWEAEARAELERLRQSTSEQSATREHDMLERHCLALARSQVEAQFARGEINERVLRVVEHWLEDQMDWLRTGHDDPLPLPEPLSHWEDWLLENAAACGAPEAVPRALERRREMLFYGVCRAAAVAFRGVLKETEALLANGALSQDLALHLRQRYGGQERRATDELARLETELPHYVEQYQASVAANFALRTERGVLEELHEKGFVSDKVMAGLEKEIAGKLRRVRHLRLDRAAREDREPGLDRAPEETLSDLGRLASDDDARAAPPEDEPDEE